MIKSFKHKGLERFFKYKDKSGIPAKQADKIETRLAVLDATSSVDGLRLPGYHLHQLLGDKKHLYSIRVTGNWRITFEFHEGNAYIINYKDYH